MVDEDASAMDFAGEELEDAAQINMELTASERVHNRRSTMTGAAAKSQLEPEEGLRGSQRAARKRK